MTNTYVLVAQITEALILHRYIFFCIVGFAVYFVENPDDTCLPLNKDFILKNPIQAKSDMFTTNLICNGGLLNKVISCADGKWCLPLEDLPAPFKAYLIGDVRYGYITSNILLAIIIQDLFPDPEVCCNLLELDQKTGSSMCSL